MMNSLVSFPFLLPLLFLLKNQFLKAQKDTKEQSTKPKWHQGDPLTDLRGCHSKTSLRNDSLIQIIALTSMVIIGIEWGIIEEETYSLQLKYNKKSVNP